MRSSCSTCHDESQQPKMRTCVPDLILVTFTSLSLLFLTCKVQSASKQPKVTFYNTFSNDMLVCHEEFMSVYIPKVEFPDLPFSIYVQDESSRYYQAIAIAKMCHYYLGETDTYAVLTVSFHGCFVRRKRYTTSLTVVIAALADGSKLEIVKSIPLICERKMKEANQIFLPRLPGQYFCSKDGFNITIPRSTTIPPLNLDAVWIPSGHNHNCKPQKRSNDTVTFSFPFTDCGTQAMISDGNITYQIKIEVKRNPRRSSIRRDTPFHLTVQCSFVLTRMTQLGFTVQQKQLEYPSTLRSKGTLRTEMRFAKDSSYRSFHSSGDTPTVVELGQPVYVEVFVVKHEDRDLVLQLEDCWATPTEDPHDPQRWKLLVKGCPYTGDSQRTVVLPVSSNELPYPSLHKWFEVKMFVFVSPRTFKNLVYFHCDVEICKRPDCLHPCSNRKRALRVTPGPGRRTFNRVVSGGPLCFLL
ncbi:zona pellucida sperm-binding protein 4-like [Amphiprion ocellaris]|uniref:ZP domain-containing protein n=1 Tax=Amphiprion ocellaris TaxID=80972 RepID=A0A3Q1AM18_AMPOC|nr:zona pellucida sperm-binding protein 4-like [Amphiprion ocellaris]